MLKIDYFKYDHRIYYGLTIEDAVLLWADEIYLGSFKGNKIIANPNLYNEYRYEYPWSIHIGADRLFKIIFEKYWCREFNKNKDIGVKLNIVDKYVSITNYASTNTRR